MTKPAAKKPMKTKTTPYDFAEQLRTPEEMAAYLDAWLEEAPDDASGIARAFGDIARAKGMTRVAKDAGLSLASCKVSPPSKGCGTHMASAPLR